MNTDPTTATQESAGPAASFNSTVLGYPRIGPRRELKFAVEKYWSGSIDAEELETLAAELRAATRAEIAGSGVAAVPGNTFSYYDQMLDTAVLVGAIPDRYAALALSPLDTYFAMARGRAGVPPLEMTKWFDTNYHYLVPEIGPGTVFELDSERLLADVREGQDQGIDVRPVLIGPLTFLLLSKPEPGAPASFFPIDRADDLVPIYAALLERLADAGAGWVQLDEPAYVADRAPAELDLLRSVYTQLAELSNRPKILVASYFGDLGPALDELAATGVDAIAVDLVAGVAAAQRIPQISALQDVLLVAGLVDGRNVWRTDLAAAASTSAALLGAVGGLAVSTSCSLLHVPYDLAAEERLDPDVARRLAFARQKLDEVVLLGRALGQHNAPDSARALDEIARRSQRWQRDRDAALRNDTVRNRIAALTPQDRRRTDYPTRAVAQQQRLRLPNLPTTTIGSFPQTADVRRARADLRAGRIDEAGYDERMRAEIDRVVQLQESWGLDVLVHGEPERNDMVQYFGEQLDGFAFTEFGWVQSYGSRCVRPPVLHGDVSRPAPMTVRWTQYAQNQTSKPMKGMLTGPVTILAWSFVRDDQPLAATADQVALALRDEVTDLEVAGIPVIQVDEPALRELLPLRESDRAAYLDWAVGAFRLATASARDATGIHTHLCYSEFGEVIGAIDGLDADVTTIEAARSRMEILDDLQRIGYTRGVGPGVYDIHSPRIPTQEELCELIGAALAVVPGERLWVNPDCGLKTRGYAEVEPTLRRMVAATRQLRTTG